jgi:hypothetical protein
LTAATENLWEIITPEATTNLGANPSLELNATNWSAVGTAATGARDNTQARFGRYSYKITTGTDVLGGGYYYTAGSGITVSSTTQYTITAYVYNPDDDARMAVWDQVPAELSNVQILQNANWQKVELTVTTGGSSTAIHVRFTNDNSGASHVMYVDGVQVEQKAYATTYCDGDQPDCKWDGIFHGSTSQRDAFGQGGKIQNLNALGIQVRKTTGFGMPAIVQNRQPYEKLPGSAIEETKIRERVASIVLEAEGSSLPNLHTLKADIIDAYKPDRAHSGVPVRMTYLGNDREIYTNLFYEDGLKGKQRTAFSETFAVRLLGADPFFYEERLEISKPAFTQSISRDHVLRRQDGEWGFPTALGATGGNVLAIAVAPDGTVYFGGSFTSFNGVTNTRGVAKLENGTIQALGDGLDDGQVNAIAIGPDDTIYFGGSFTNVDDLVTANNIFRYTPSTDTISTMDTGPGVNGAVHALAIGLDGTLYLGGEFTDEGDRLATWDGTTFADPFGTGSASPIRALAIAPDGDLFVGGDFTSINAVTANRIAEWDISSSVFTAVGGNGQLNAECRALLFSPDGKLYAGGDFTTASGNTVNRIAIWGGSDWLPMETGVDNDVYSLAWIDGLLWLGGNFTATDAGLNMPDLGIWNGSTFVRPDITLPSSPIVNAIAGSGKDVYVGHQGTGAATVGDTTVLTNNGTAAAYPIAVFTGPGTLKWIENVSTREILYFDLEAQDGEEITIDFRPAEKSITSNWRIYGLQPQRGSDFGSFHLKSGSNTIAAFITGTTGSTELHFRWQVTHWSRDGA